MSSSDEKELFSGLTFDQMLGLEDTPPDGKPLAIRFIKPNCPRP